MNLFDSNGIWTGTPINGEEIEWIHCNCFENIYIIYYNSENTKVKLQRSWKKIKCLMVE